MVSKTLGEISTFITKGATPTTYGYKWQTFGVPFLRSECVSSRGLDMRQSMFISEGADQSLRRSRVKDGDILMTITGNVGRVVRLTGLGSANINQHIARVRIKDRNFDPGYVYHFLSQGTMREYYESIVTGQAFPQISLVQVRSTPVPRVGIEEQKAIASALDDADNLIATIERLIAKKQAVQQGLMQGLLTGKVRLAGFTGGWRRCQLLEISDIHRNSIDPRRHKSREFQHYSLPAFDDGEQPIMQRGSLIDSVKFVVPDGAILISKLNPRIPRVWSPLKVGPDAIASTEFVIITPSVEMDRSFLSWMMKSESVSSRMRLLATGTTGSHARIHPSQVMQLEVQVPQIDEQREIAKVLDDASAEIAMLVRRLVKARAIKQGMLQQLLTGRARLPAEVAA